MVSASKNFSAPPDPNSNVAPIYLDILEDGVVLFERNDTIFNFLNDIRRNVDYRKEIVGNNVVVRWRIKA